MATGTYKKEWLGIEGYCNCLLVTMSRLEMATLTLATDQPVPNLENMASGFANTREWLVRQQFNYEAIPAKLVIECFAQRSRIKKGLFGYPARSTAIFPVIDLVGDDGPALKRRFDFVLERFGKRIRFEMKLDPSVEEVKVPPSR